MRRGEDDRLLVRSLLIEGHSLGGVAERSGVSVSTIRRWRASFGELPIHWRPAHASSYAYLLGMYLGDGCISQSRGRVLLRVSLDVRYPVIVDECQTAMQLTMPDSRAGLLRVRGTGAVVVQSSGKRWLNAFPQHGPGHKHLRSIRLEPWQGQIVERHRGSFVRGLIHSDGCRTINAFRTRLPSGRVASYAYPRYFFSNLSADIRELFCGSCDALGVRWTRSNPRNISVAHRGSVAILDALGCAKE